jgi:hypothetical protein
LLRDKNSDLISEETVRRMQERKPDFASVTLGWRGRRPFLDETEAGAAIDAFLADLP